MLPISLLIYCTEYKLIKKEINENEDEDVAEENKKKYILNNKAKYKQFFKLDADELLTEEQITFNIVNSKNNEQLDFLITAKSLTNNSSEMPSFPKIKGRNNFKLTIPKYGLKSNNKEILRLNCFLEILIEEDFFIFIEIDALIKPDLIIFKIYDFYTRPRPSRGAGNPRMGQEGHRSHRLRSGFSAVKPR